MTSKQKVALVAAQYAAKAREMTREGDLLMKLSDLLDEEGAQKMFDQLQRLGLVDSEGVITETAPSQIELAKEGSAN